MDILNMIKMVFTILLFFTANTAHKVQAQVDDDLIQAFKTSYQYETSSDYYNAINVLKNKYDAKNYELNLRLGWLFYLNQQYSESMDYYQKSIDLMPYSVEAKFGYVYPAAAAEKWDKVEKQYSDILSIDPNNSVANYRLGMIYYYKPDYQASYRYFEKVINSYPFDYSSVIMFAWTNFKLGKTSDAKAYFNKALLMKPDDASALEGLALVK